jgi:hypothetical protein
MRPPRTIAVLALAAVAAGAAGCGTSAATEADLKAIRALVTRFAAAHDASACRMLMGSALISVYGGGGQVTARQARAKCVKKSVAFKGEPIRITNAQLLDDLTGKVNAENQARTFTYSIDVHRGTTHYPWKIDSISQYKAKP